MEWAFRRKTLWISGACSRIRVRIVQIFSRHGVNYASFCNSNFQIIYITAYAKVKEANGGNDVPSILWTSELASKEHILKYLSNQTYIIQIWTNGKFSIIDYYQKYFNSNQ